MSARQAAEFKALATSYDVNAERFPEGSAGRIGNRVEAAKYHDLAARAEQWPEGPSIDPADAHRPSNPPCDMTADCPAPKHSKGCWRGHWAHAGTTHVPEGGAS